MKQAIFVVDIYKKGTTECIGFTNIGLEHVSSVSSGEIIQLVAEYVVKQGEDLTFKIVGLHYLQ